MSFSDCKMFLPSVNYTDVPQYVIKPYPGSHGRAVFPKHDTYPIRVSREGRCWKCKERKKPLYACGTCRCVRYCSKACQKDDWPRHQNICRPASFYDMSKCAIISPREEEQLRAMEVAYKLIDEEHIHPNRILINRHLLKNDLYFCSGFFDLDYPDLMSVLERGLSACGVIHDIRSYRHFNEANTQLLLAYGGQDLYFPLQSDLPVIKYLVSKGCDPDEVYNPHMLSDETIFFLASVGCTFPKIIMDNPSRSGSVFEMLRNLIPGCEDIVHDYLDTSAYITVHRSFLGENFLHSYKVKKIIQAREATIISVLSKNLIPVLTNIVIGYTKVSQEYQQTSRNYYEDIPEVD